jgi:hypothetical protein
MALHLLSDVSHIGHEAERDTFSLNAIANVTATVMGYREGGDAEITYDEVLSHLYGLATVSRDFLWNAEVAHYALMDSLGCIDRNVVFGTDDPHRLDMVSMVMSDEDMVYTIQAETVVVEMFLYISYANTCVYQYRVVGSLQEVTVTAASTAYGQKF